MKFFVRHSTPKTLLLIDEFGTGTEPQIGGAIAEATLERFNRNGAFGVITTHYTNLKHFAEETEGIVNGAMLYDRQHLQPLFALDIGKPGSSFAVEIARKIGLPEDLIKDAADKVGAEHIDYDKHLQDIVRDKRYWEQKRQQIRQKEKQLDEKISAYEEKNNALQTERKAILSEAKTKAQGIVNDANAVIEKTIREIKEAQAEKEQTREIRKNLEKFKENLEQEIKSKEQGTQNKDKKHRKENKQQQILNLKSEIYSGDTVQIIGQNGIGRVIDIKENNALVAFGSLQSFVKVERLEKISRNAAKKTQVKPKSSVTDNLRNTKLAFRSEIDVRGMRAEEALLAVTYFIDDAVMVGVGAVRILHGTGTGALRQAIRQYLNTVPNIKTCRDEHVQFGGAGITVVEFE
jgi:DNA mismatch repair protein MutS2